MDGWDAPKSKRDVVARLGGRAHHPWPFPLRDSVCVIPKLRIVIIWKIMILEKSQVNLSPYRSLKLKKIHKQGFPVLQSYNQNKEDSLENPQKQLNTWI